MYLSFQLQINQKEREISEFEMDFKKSRLSSSLNSTYTRSENGHGFKSLKRVWEITLLCVWNRVRILRTERLTPIKNSREYPPQPPGVPTRYLREILYLMNENSFQFCGGNYPQTHGTAMGTKIAVASANILMVRIEDQPGHQRIFLGCGGMLRCRCRPSNSRLRCQKQRSRSWTQKCTKGLDLTRNQS